MSIDSTEYYIVVNNHLVNVREMARAEDADDIVDEMESIVGRRQDNAEPLTVHSSYLTPAKPGPLDTSLVADAAGERSGIDLIQITDPYDGVTSYVLPQKGALETVEDVAGGMDLEEFHALADALDEHFYDRFGQQVPAQVVRIGLDRGVLDSMPLLSEPFVQFIEEQLKRPGIGKLTVLQWTE